MPIFQDSYRKTQHEDNLRARNAQRDVDSLTRFYESENGKVAISKAITKYLRIEIPIQKMREILQTRANTNEDWHRAMRDKDIWITPEEFILWHKPAVIKPSRDHIWQVVANATTRNSNKRFYWSYMEPPQFYDQARQDRKWIFCTSDWTLSPIRACQHHDRLWHNVLHPNNQLPLFGFDDDDDDQEATNNPHDDTAEMNTEQAALANNAAAPSNNWPADSF